MLDVCSHCRIPIDMKIWLDSYRLRGKVSFNFISHKNITLIDNTKLLISSDFIVRMLYKYSY